LIRTAATIDISQVTSEQIGACHKIIHQDGNFYMVESASDPDKEYKVTWSESKGFQCQCKASEYGNLCWHIKASVACSREEREYMSELAASCCVPQAVKAVEITYTTVDLVTRARIEAASERQASKPVSKAKGQTRGFSLMR
jgi:hypothetical protein